MTVPTSKCIPILLRPTIAILCFLLTHLSFDVLAQDICENPVEEVNGFVPPQEYSPEVVIRIDRLSKFPNRDSAAVLCININTPGLYRIKTTIEYSLGTEQNNESFFMHVTNSSNKVIDPCNPNLGPHRVIVPDPTQANKTIIERDAGVFPFTQGINIISFVHYYRIHDRKPEYGKFVNGKFDTTKVESVKLLKLILEPLPTCPTRTLSNYDLRLTKSVSPAVVSPGQEFNYSMQIANLGPDKALNINLTDLLPDSIFPKSFTMNPPVDLTARPLEWRFAALDSGEVVHIEFSAIFPDSFDISADSLQKSNTSYIDADFDTNTQNDTALAVVTIKKQTPAYDLVLTKKVNPSTVVAGEIFTYSLQIRNNGPDTANNIRLTDLLPDSIYPVNFITDMPIDPTARILKWQLKPLAFGEVVHIEFSAIFPDSFDISADSLQKSNTSYIDADFDTNTQNDTALAVVTIKKQTSAYDLVLTKKVNPSTIVAGEIFTYSLQIRNNGPDAANNIRLTDLLPDSIYPVNFITDMPIDPTARILKWQLKPLAFGEVAHIEFSAIFPDSFDISADSLQKSNTSYIDADFDTNTQNDTALAVVTINTKKQTPVYDLGLTKNASPSTIVAGEIFTYSLQIRNNGPDTANNIRLTDLLPDSIYPVNFITDMPIDPTARILNWDLTSLDSGAIKNIKFTATFMDSLGSTTRTSEFINTSFVGARFDQNTKNDTARAQISVLPRPPNYDLILTKAVSRDTVVQGQTFSYTLEITNNGPEAVPGFSVWDAFPGGLSLSDFSLQPIDAFAADTLRWQIEQPLLPGEKIAIVYTGLCPVVSNFTNPQTQINTARVIGANDSDPTNNSATASVVCLPPTDSCDEFVNLDRSLFKPDDQTPLAITVELDVITDISLDIFDIAGYPIKRISTTNATVGLNTFFWDGQTNEGLKAGSGVYIVVVRDKVISGQILECIKKVLVVR